MVASEPTMTVYPIPEGGKLHGTYQIVKVIGAGGFGITYLAWDLANSRHIVIKECLPAEYAVRDQETLMVHAKGPETEQMFKDCIGNAMLEAKTLASFSHPGVVQIYDLFEENGTFYYVMEQIVGKTLFEIMMDLRAKGETLPPEQAEGVLLNLLDILDHLHAQQIYHCDIKPGNIFIAQNGMPKLIDFGAVRSKELQHQGLVQITPGYTPPEFYPGRLRELGPWCDLYELGATMYELLTGTVPEPGDKRIVCDRTVKIASVEKYRSRYPLPLLAGIDKALEPDTANRFKTAQRWVEFMDAYTAGPQLSTVASSSHVNRRLKVASSLKTKKKSSSAGIWIVLLLLIIGGYFAYTEGLIKLEPTKVTKVEEGSKTHKAAHKPKQVVKIIEEVPSATETGGEQDASPVYANPFGKSAPSAESSDEDDDF
jgi:serine/threonine protein kinase